MAWSVNDLTSITDVLKARLEDGVRASPLWVDQHFPFEVSGLMPAVSRNDSTNVLSLYLLHVGRDPYWRNAPVQGPRGQLNPSQPLSLDLSYLLTSYSEKNWQMEQYLMSVALSYFHANPIYTSATAEFTVTVEADSIEEMSRLWQAITVPIRLSTMFRVAVVFLTPKTPPPAPARQPVVATLSVGPDLNEPTPIAAAQPRLFEIALQVTYRVAPTATATKIAMLPAPAQPVMIAGQSLRARGSGLDSIDASSVFLSPATGGAEWPVTAWRVPGTSASGTAGERDELVLHFPVAYASPPTSGTPLTATPLPGMYLLTVGNTASGFRSNVLPLAIAPRVDNVGPGQPLITPDSTGVYTMAASGLIPGQTSVMLENAALSIGAPPAPGIAKVDVAAGSIAWMLPGGLTPKSLLRVRIIVNNVEAPPGWWVKAP